MYKYPDWSRSMPWGEGTSSKVSGTLINSPTCNSGYSSCFINFTSVVRRNGRFFTKYNFQNNQLPTEFLWHYQTQDIVDRRMNLGVSRLSNIVKISLKDIKCDHQPEMRQQFHPKEEHLKEYHHLLKILLFLWLISRTPQIIQNVTIEKYLQR